MAYDCDQSQSELSFGRCFNQLLEKSKYAVKFGLIEGAGLPRPARPYSIMSETGEN